jgi:integrase/recombinase XerC
MGRKGKRKRLAEGIYKDDSGIAARVRVGSGATQIGREKRYPLGTDLKTIQRWQLTTRAELLGDLPAKAARGSLAAAVPSYLSTLTGRRKNDARALLQHWIDSLGSLDRAAVTRTHVLAQLAAWEEAGVAASSINHRLLELRALYRELDANDPSAVNPTFDIRKRREPEATPRAVPYDLIEAIIAYMPDRGRTMTPGATRPTASQTKARARVMAWTGLPPAQVMKIQPGDVDWQAQTLRVTPRRKGKGTKARTVPLLPQAVEALKWFFASGATGPYSTSAFYKTWQTAQRRLVRELKRLVVQQGQDPHAISLPRIRPYDLRHSFGTEAVRRSSNILGVQTLMLHARVSTTERYLKSALDHSAQQVIEMWGERPGASKP